MIITLHNKHLSIQISTTGAEMQAITSADGTDYLWDGNPEFWGNRATNLFPYVGRLCDKTYLLDGKRYELGIHGFFRFMETVPREQSDTRVWLETTDNKETNAQYPLSFSAGIDYRLAEETLFFTCRVINTGNKTMYFGLRGH